MNGQNDTDLTTLEMVASAQKRSIVRDRLVAAFLAIGLVVGVSSINSMAYHATHGPTTADVTRNEPVILASALVVDIDQSVKAQ